MCLIYVVYGFAHECGCAKTCDFVCRLQWKNLCTSMYSCVYVHVHFVYVCPCVCINNCKSVCFCVCVGGTDTQNSQKMTPASSGVMLSDSTSDIGLAFFPIPIYLPKISRVPWSSRHPETKRSVPRQHFFFTASIKAVDENAPNWGKMDYFQRVGGFHKPVS